MVYCGGETITIMNIKLSLLLIALLGMLSPNLKAQKIKNEELKTQSNAFITKDNLQWKSVGEGIQRAILGYNGQIMMVKIKFAKGAKGTLHRHYHTQVTYVESGKFRFTINGKSRVVVGGDALYMEPDVVHGCVCLEPGVLIDCFSPMRENFLPKKGK